MDPERLKAIKEMLAGRTIKHTASKKSAREWILRDGVHRSDGWLIRDPSDDGSKTKKTG